MIKWCLALIFLFKTTLLFSSEITDCDKFAGSVIDQNNPTQRWCEWDDLILSLQYLYVKLPSKKTPMTQELFSNLLERMKNLI